MKRPESAFFLYQGERGEFMKWRLASYCVGRLGRLSTKGTGITVDQVLLARASEV